MSTVDQWWTAAPTPTQQQRVRELVEAATHADGVEPVGEQVLLALRGHETRHLLATDPADNAVVGYANLVPAGDEPDATPFVELVVAPGHRRRGTGAALLAAALAEGGDGTRVWAHGDLAPARALAGRLGLHPVRELLQMRRSLTDELPPQQVPDDLTIRSFDPERDVAELLRVNAAAFAWHPEQGRWGPADVAERVGEEWFDADGVLLARDAGVDGANGPLLGFHWTKVHLDTPGLGEVYVVGVDPGAQGRGLGRVLTLAGLHHLADRGMDTVLLYVEGDNTAAVHTYTRLGFATVHTDTAYARS